MRLRWPSFTMGQDLGLKTCPYMRRWIAHFGAFSLRVHRWQASDDDEAFHDHPWWFLTLVLRGGYTDVSPTGIDELGPGSIRLRSATHRHTVQVHKPGTWTLVLTGPAARRWGFWVGDKLWKRDRYFATRGHHPCSPGNKRVRLRPDGMEIH